MKTRNLVCPLILVWTGITTSVQAEEAVLLGERFFQGYHYHVNVRVEVSGTLTLPPEKGQSAPRTLGVAGKSAIEYDERVLMQGADNNVPKSVRWYQRMDFERKVGDQLQQNSLRAEVRRLVLLRRNQVEVPFSPAGPLTWGEIDMVRTDVFTPALAGLLPAKAVRPGDSWQAGLPALQELTDLERIDEGSLTCKLEAIVTVSNRRHARIRLTGSVRGLGEDGPTKHQLDGSFFFDLESNHISYLSLKGLQFLLDKTGKPAGQIEGTFVLTRQPYVPCQELTDDALRGLVLEPNDDNTLLLYDNPELGVRLLYPRRWRVAGVNGRQIGLDETNGSGLLLTLEALARLPSGNQYLQESRTWLGQQKAAVFKSEAPRLVQGPPRSLEAFAIDAQAGGQRVRLDYYVIRQQLGGATLAARLLPNDLQNLQRDAERIARSVQITRQQ